MYCLTCDLTWSDLFANLKTPASLFVCASMHNLQHIFPQIIKKNQYRFREKREYSENCIKNIHLTFRTQGPFSVCLPCGPAMLSRQKSSRDPPGGSPDFLAKSLVILTKYIQNSSLSLTNLSLNFIYMAGITRRFTKTFENIFVAFCHRL